MNDELETKVEEIKRTPMCSARSSRLRVLKSMKRRRRVRDKLVIWTHVALLIARRSGPSAHFAAV